MTALLSSSLRPDARIIQECPSALKKSATRCVLGGDVSNNRMTLSESPVNFRKSRIGE